MLHGFQPRRTPQLPLYPGARFLRFELKQNATFREFTSNGIWADNAVESLPLLRFPSSMQRRVKEPVFMSWLWMGEPGMPESGARIKTSRFMRPEPPTGRGEAVFSAPNAIVKMNKAMAFSHSEQLLDRCPMAPCNGARRAAAAHPRLESPRAKRNGGTSIGRQRFQIGIARKFIKRSVVSAKIKIGHPLPILVAPQMTQRHAVCTAASED